MYVESAVKADFFEGLGPRAQAAGATRAVANPLPSTYLFFKCFTSTVFNMRGAKNSTMDIAKIFREEFRSINEKTKTGS